MEFFYLATVQHSSGIEKNFIQNYLFRDVLGTVKA